MYATILFEHPVHTICNALTLENSIRLSYLFCEEVLCIFQESAEFKIAKVAITNVILWYLTWTPYAVVVMMGQFGDRTSLSPLASQVHFWPIEKPLTGILGTINTNYLTRLVDF